MLSPWTCTPEHPLYAVGNGWTAASQLSVGDALATRAGPALVVQSVKWRQSSAGFRVCNLTVDGDHTYFVGVANGGLWAHNADCFSRSDRLNEFFNRLHNAPNANTPEEALGQVRETLNGVEDEMSGIPHDPVPGRGVQNGRMYPPFNDSVINNADGSLSAMTRSHQLDLGADGSINISPRSGGESVFSKPEGGGL